MTICRNEGTTVYPVPYGEKSFKIRVSHAHGSKTFDDVIYPKDAKYKKGQFETAMTLKINELYDKYANLIRHPELRGVKEIKKKDVIIFVGEQKKIIFD